MLKKIREWIHKDCESDRDTLLGRILAQARYIDQIKLQSEKQTIQNPLESWSVSPESVFSVSKTGLIMLNGEQLTVQELKNLKSEIRALKEFKVYQILQNTLRQKAIEKAVLTSTDLYSLKGNEQVLAGKMMVYSLDIIKTIIESVDKAKLASK